MRLVSSGSVTLCLDARITSEYEEVLARPRFGFDPDAVAALLDFVVFKGETAACKPLASRLPDVDDEPFLEAAIACGADCVVTGNLAHFPEELRAGVRVVSPAEFMDWVRSEAAGGDT
jgi:predicted nucleic acid-binding protein